jgi:hypothetical protein
MNGARMAARILVVTAIVMMMVGAVGFVATLMLNAFVLDKYNAYGEVPIPGTGTLHLPAGEVTVSLHTQVISSPNGTGLPVPRLGLTVVPPPGVADPQVTESFGSTTTINNDAHRRVWLMQVPAEGDYKITTEGQVNGFISPQLAFGHGGTAASGNLVWIFVGLFAVGLIGTIGAPIWLARTRVANSTAWQPTPIDLGAPVATPSPEGSLSTYAPNDEGVKLEQLKTLSSLRASGALTEAEFETEKRRILDGR